MRSVLVPGYKDLFGKNVPPLQVFPKESRRCYVFPHVAGQVVCGQVVEQNTNSIKL